MLDFKFPRWRLRTGPSSWTCSLLEKVAEVSEEHIVFIFRVQA
jgi:hypothetical protein